MAFHSCLLESDILVFWIGVVIVLVLWLVGAVFLLLLLLFLFPQIRSHWLACAFAAVLFHIDFHHASSISRKLYQSSQKKNIQKHTKK